MKYPNIFNVADLRGWSVSTEIDGQWVAARPLGFHSIFSRIRIAWLVFTGKADAVVWPKGQ